MIFLPRRILAFFLAGNKKLSTGLDRANTARFVSLFRLLLMPLRFQSKSISWAMDAPTASVQDMKLKGTDLFFNLRLLRYARNDSVWVKTNVRKIFKVPRTHLLDFVKMDKRSDSFQSFPNVFARFF